MSSQFRTNLTRTALGAAGAAALGIGYASGIERNAFALREVTMPVLAPGSSSLRVLHLSDLHMMPNQRLKQNWLRELEGLDPDLVVNTGDNLSHQRSVPAVSRRSAICWLGQVCSSSAATTTSLRNRRIH